MNTHTEIKKILLAGATGYLGSYILSELEKRDFQIKAISRKMNKLSHITSVKTQVIEAEVTKPKTLENICDDCNYVISTIGITKQKDGLTYMDVDYQANFNLLQEAKKSKVEKFIYVSVLNGENLMDVAICNAKEKFVDELKKSGIDYCIIRPNGFFSDIKEFYTMAQKGSVYLFGDGTLKANPIHGQDLAEVCVDALFSEQKEIEIGGPQILTQNEIALTAFNVLNKKPKIIHIPDWIRKISMKILRLFMSNNSFGPIEFFMTVMAIEMIAPQHGKHTLKEFFEGMKTGKTS